MNKKSYYESPSIEIIELPKFSVLTVSGGEDMKPDGEYGPDGWIE